MYCCRSSTVQNSTAPVVQLFSISRRTMSGNKGGMLVNESKYSFLKELGLGEVNDGVYDGKWFGSGEVSDCMASVLYKGYLKMLQLICFIRDGRQTFEKIKEEA